MVRTTISVSVVHLRCFNLSAGLLIFCIAGRIRKGPAPVSLLPFLSCMDSHVQIYLQLNLEVPQYDFNDAEGKLIIG